MFWRNGTVPPFSALKYQSRRVFNTEKAANTIRTRIYVKMDRNRSGSKNTNPNGFGLSDLDSNIWHDRSRRPTVPDCMRWRWTLDKLMTLSNSESHSVGFTKRPIQLGIDLECFGFAFGFWKWSVGSLSLSLSPFGFAICRGGTQLGLNLRRDLHKDSQSLFLSW